MKIVFKGKKQKRASKYATVSLLSYKWSRLQISKKAW